MEKKKPVVPIVVTVVVAIAIGIGAFIALRPKKQVAVPSVTYYYEEQAEQMLAEAGLKLGEVTVEQNEGTNEDPFDGLIIGQSPAAKETVDEGSTVNITVAKGRPIPTSVIVPDLKGMSPEEAEMALVSAFIFSLPGEPVYSDDVEPGKVCDQSAVPGSSLQITAEQFKNGEWPIVSYSTSLGKEQVKVPDVVGKTSQEARDALTNAGLAIDTTSSFSDKVEADRIISQSIPKDSTVAKGTIVSIEISQGKKPVDRVAVPDIRTYTLEEAKRTLESAGLNYTYTGNEAGRVITVKPQPYTEVDKGSTVTFTIELTAEQRRQEEQERKRQEEERKRQEEEQKRQEEEQKRQDEEQRRQEEERQRQEEERQRQEQEQQQQEQQVQEETQSQPQYISEDDAIISAAIAATPAIGDADIQNTTVELVLGGDAPHYVVYLTTEPAGYRIEVDAYTGDIMSMVILQ